MDLQLQIGLGRGWGATRCASGCTLLWQVGKEPAEINRIARGVASVKGCRDRGAIDFDDGMGWDVAKDGSSGDLDADGRRVEEQFWRDSSSQQRHARPPVLAASVFRPAKQKVPCSHSVPDPNPLLYRVDLAEPGPLATGRGGLFFSDGPKPAAGDDPGISQAKPPFGFSASCFATPARKQDKKPNCTSTMLYTARTVVPQLLRGRLAQATTTTPSAFYSPTALRRLASTLAILEQREGKLNHGSLSAITAAKKIGGAVHGFVAGSSIKAVADEAATADGVEKIIAVDSGAYDKVGSTMHLDTHPTISTTLPPPLPQVARKRVFGYALTLRTRVSPRTSPPSSSRTSRKADTRMSSLDTRPLART